MNNNKIAMTVVAIVIVLVAAYGGYRLYKHYARVSAPAPVAQTPTKAVTPTAVPNEVYKMSQNAKLGSYLTDPKGMTLYTFAKDKPGVSNCAGPCLKLWPAFVATAGATTNLPANLTVFKRSDGAEQYAYKGMPLYYYYLDKAPGDTFGEGVLGLWFVAK